ncbi:MAG: BLUF domain-containing protein [Ardenticatenaceae bacterium]|nr:BLUF domain-containing protein [Ardenticatenaceae bacterium]
MLSLVYASSAVRLFNRQELFDLLEYSREMNVENDITGMLLYRGGNFIQVIEGEDEAVLQLYKNIKADPRHKDVTMLSQDPIAKRQFPDWRMGFRNIDQMSEEELAGFSSFLDNDFSPAYFKDKPTRAYILLLSFKDSMTD